MKLRGNWKENERVYGTKGEKMRGK